VGRLVLLEEGQTHSFLLAESRKAVRRNVPQKRAEVPLVDLPVVPPLPTPPRDGNGAFLNTPRPHWALDHLGRRTYNPSSLAFTPTVSALLPFDLCIQQMACFIEGSGRQL
jgi:hypothetical protein